MSLVVLLRQYALAWTPMVDTTCSTHCMVKFLFLDACSCCLHTSFMVITSFVMFMSSRNAAMFLAHLLSGLARPCTMVGTSKRFVVATSSLSQSLSSAMIVCLSTI